MFDLDDFKKLGVDEMAKHKKNEDACNEILRRNHEINIKLIEESTTPDLRDLCSESDPEPF